MLLDRIDIDAHGPLCRVELGPLAEHMNVICGPEGSGKTAIARFVRDSLMNRRYPLGMMNSSTGRVVWADQNGKIHCRREQDGTNDGRRTIEFESRGDHRHDYRAFQHSWLGGITGSTDASRAAGSIQLPESIVDCVITDTSVTNVARIVSACVRNRLDSPETYRSLPLAEEPGYLDRDASGSQGYRSDRPDRHRELRAQLADIEAELARIEAGGIDYDALIARRNELSSRLARGGKDLSYEYTGYGHPSSHDRDRQGRLRQLSDRADRLRRRQVELRRWIAELDAELSRVRAYDYAPYGLGARSYSDYRETVYRNHANTADENLRRRLDDLDAQMIRWRRTLMEVHGLREAILREHVPSSYHRAPIEDVIRRRQRLDGFLHTVDRYSDDHYRDDYLVDRDTVDRFQRDTFRSQSRADEIESRIDAATRQIDWLLQRYRQEGAVYDWYQSMAPAERPSTTLSEALQTIRNELHQVAGVSRRQHHQHQQTAAQLTAEVADRRHAQYRSATTSETSAKLDELQDSERWLVSAIEQLTHHREVLLRNFASSVADSTPEVQRSTPWNIHLWDAAGYEQERVQRSRELDRVTAELGSCLDEAAECRRSTHYSPVLDRDSGQSWLDVEAIRSELHRIDASLSLHSRSHWLRTRRADLLDQLQVVRRPGHSRSPLAEDASRWLVRLSAGRLRRISWDQARFHDHSSGPNRYRHAGFAEDANGARLAADTGVQIDGRDEAVCPAADRAIASLAVRLAAGELLARTGRTVPLVIETGRELLVDTYASDGARTFDGDYTFDRDYTPASNPYSLRGLDHQYYGTPLSFYQDGDDRHSNHPIAAALHDYSRGGRQVVVLTSDLGLSDEIARAGGRRFDLRGEHLVHPHRPMWRSNTPDENYVGPHPDPRAAVTTPPGSDVNRYFDVAWREEYGVDQYAEARSYPSPIRSRRTRTDWAADGCDYRDGYYYVDTYTTMPTREARHEVPHGNSATLDRPVAYGRPATPKHAKPESPFFLNVDSPIDQAPSIDAIAAARLRGLNVSHINHLMQQDSNRLSDALGLANVDAATVRRWQSECRLVCRVPQLRGFDARILVGCGITDPAQLAAIAPASLLDRVKVFLATEQGQRILLSGSSYELSRITSWIAAANSTTGSKNGFGARRNGTRTESGNTALDRSHDDFDNARYEYEYPSGESTRRHSAGNGNRGGGGRRRRGNRIRTVGDINRDLNDIDLSESDDSTHDGYGEGTSRSRRGRQGRRQPSARDLVRLADERVSDAYRSNEDYEDEDTERRTRSRRGSNASRGDGTRRRSRKSGSKSSSRSGRAKQSPGQGRTTERETTLRFYLQRDSDVVDAPSIGARMAERLNAIGIHTVDDLLQADPETTATELDYRKVDADTIVAWQQQAALVCRVPMLRGHDAQLLVAAEVTSPEELVTYTPDDLFALIDPISHSSEGKRILRGGSLPDLDEITEWIGYGQHHRELMAA